MGNERMELPANWSDWEIIKKIGKGSYGTVYKVKRILMGKELFCAVKVIDIPHDEDELESIRQDYGKEASVHAYLQSVVSDYIKEIELMASLKGISNIVTIEDFVVEEKGPSCWRIYIRMEYLQSFLQYSNAHKMSEEEIVRLATDICSALEYCEKKTIIHRDIKPENIFLSDMGDFKLGDFGIAREGGISFGSYSSKGTFSYMAPEVYMGRHYNANADIYSLGIVLYRLTNQNRFPFENIYKQIIPYHEREEAFGRRINGEALPKPVNASDALSEIILKACAFDPEKRYRNAGELKTALAKCITGGSIAKNEEKSTDKGDKRHDEDFAFASKAAGAAAAAFGTESSAAASGSSAFGAENSAAASGSSAFDAENNGAADGYYTFDDESKRADGRHSAFGAESNAAVSGSSEFSAESSAASGDSSAKEEKKENKVGNKILRVVAAAAIAALGFFGGQFVMHSDFGTSISAALDGMGSAHLVNEVLTENDSDAEEESTDSDKDNTESETDSEDIQIVEDTSSDEKVYQVTAEHLTVRAEPEIDDGNELAFLNNGDQVTGTGNISEDEKWLEIYYSSDDATATGWASASYLQEVASENATATASAASETNALTAAASGTSSSDSAASDTSSAISGTTASGSSATTSSGDNTSGTGSSTSETTASGSSSSSKTASGTTSAASETAASGSSSSNTTSSDSGASTSGTTSSDTSSAVSGTTSADTSSSTSGTT
ncbi:MAG: serine/threonine protein kinase [Lachnospiraceae bacterium]|nr:serine/threonine protein kinase [Lachnospiraceae bacterium]